ncbi:hypothetical protein N7449_007577 [Penicillium cf. viridicatum]|uniref:Uncharacterized protein n=1 Tax=Penicillium cf. viridicatum TaxID=2972119 RepID=A0A9W9JHL2_9EURO|nr:hypothetical protein N7449_007577 [Penicillium cf. viridicatum]
MTATSLRDPHGRIPGERMLLQPEAALTIIRNNSRQSYLFAFRCDPMTALGRYVCGKSGLGGYHTPRHAIQPVSPPSFDLPTHPRTHTRGHQSFVLTMIMEIDHLEFILLPKNPQQPHNVSKRNLVNGGRFNTIFF